MSIDDIIILRKNFFELRDTTVANDNYIKNILVTLWLYNVFIIGTKNWSTYYKNRRYQYIDK